MSRDDGATSNLPLRIVLGAAGLFAIFGMTVLAWRAADERVHLVADIPLLLGLAVVLGVLTARATAVDAR